MAPTKATATAVKAGPAKAAARPVPAPAAPRPVAVVPDPEPEIVDPMPDDDSVPGVAEPDIPEDEPESTTDDSLAATDEEPLTDEEQLINLANSLGIDLIFEDRPTAPSPIGRTGAPPVPWEVILGGLRENPGMDTRVKEWPANDEKAKSRAGSMARAMRVRLFQTCPDELWDITHKLDPTTNTWKIFAKYERQLTPAETQDRIAKRQAIAERLTNSRK